MPESPVKMKITEAALLLCGGEENLEVYDGAVKTYEHLSRGLQWRDRGRVIAAGVMSKGAIAGTNYLIEAETIGRNF